MTYFALLRRARRLRRQTYRLIARHRLIARTDAWSALLRRAGALPPQASTADLGQFAAASDLDDAALDVPTSVAPAEGDTALPNAELGDQMPEQALVAPAVPSDDPAAPITAPPQIQEPPPRSTPPAGPARRDIASNTPAGAARRRPPGWQIEEVPGFNPPGRTADRVPVESAQSMLLQEARADLADQTEGQPPDATEPIQLAEPAGLTEPAQLAEPAQPTEPALPRAVPIPEPARPLVAQPEALPAHPTPPPERPSEELFASNDTDRSPEAWMARLTGAANTPPERESALPNAAIAQTQSPPLAEPARLVTPPPPTERQPPTIPPGPPARPNPGRPEELPSIPAGSQPAPASELFAPQPTDRSPQAWVERLRQEQAPTAAPTRPAQAAPPELPARLGETPARLPRPMQRFLAPLVGIDPDSVRIFRGASADQAVASQSADAVAAGEDVLLGAGHDIGDPRTAGVLAHELTHVARRREPRFVPPLLRGTRAESLDEESLAQSAEVQTTRLARSWIPDAPALAQPYRTPPGEVTPVRLPPARTRSATPENVAAEVFSNAEPPPGPVRPHPIWGNLPAPWQPMTFDGAAPLDSSAVAPSNTPAPRAAASAAGGEPAAALAELGRPLDMGDSDGNATQAAAPPQNIHLDANVDALARQVYAVLKRRLLAERRRTS